MSALRGQEDTEQHSQHSLQSNPHLQPSTSSETDLAAMEESNNVTGQSASGLPSTSVRKTDKDFKFVRILGEGSFSTVYVGRSVDTDQEFAIKVCMKDLIRKEKKQEYVKRERNVMALLIQNPHPFFVKLYCTFQDAERLYFVMSWEKNGEMLDWMKKLGSFDEAVTRFYAAEIVLALEHLHSLGIIHRDLKPENVLLSESMHIRLADFGSSKILDSPDGLPIRPTPLMPEKRRSFVGTAQYVSPEILASQQSTTGCDWWGLGCIVYQMLSGLPPFRAANDYLIFRKIQCLDYSYPDGFNEIARDLVQKLLIVNVTQRLGSPETGGSRMVREHPFFTGIDWESLPALTPPDMKPFLPATADNEPLHGNYKVPDNFEPGLDDRQLTRLLGLDLADPKAPTPFSNKDPVRLLTLKESERRELLSEQINNNPYHRFVEGNLIVKCGLLDKRKGLFARTRMFLLTEGPRLYYIDPANMEMKGQIPWSKSMRAEPKNFKTFFVNTPSRIYYLIDHTGYALEWCQVIEEVRKFYFPDDDTAASIAGNT